MLSHRVRVKKVVGGDGPADTLESLDANNTPLTLKEMGVRRFHVAHSLKGEETCVCVRRTVCECLSVCVYLQQTTSSPCNQPNPQVSQQKGYDVDQIKRNLENSLFCGLS